MYDLEILGTLVRPHELIDLVPRFAGCTGRCRILAEIPGGYRLLSLKSHDKEDLTLEQVLKRGVGFATLPDPPRDPGSIEKESVLAAFGYRVGKTNGLATPNRRAILVQVYNASFLDCVKRLPRADTLEWGDSRSARRLEFMAHRLAQNVTNQRDQGSPALQAIEEWEDDRAWL
jgi:hypothetical protein